MRNSHGDVITKSQLFTTGTEVGKYPETLVANFKLLGEEAKEVLSDPNATKQQIESIIERGTASYDALVQSINKPMISDGTTEDC